MLRIPFMCFEFGFECFESLSNLHSNGLNLDSDASNPFQMVRTWIRMVRIPFGWFEFGLECPLILNGYNLHLNALNPFRMV